MKRWPKGTYMKLTSKDTLRALIEQRRLSYADIGTMAGCHRSMVSQLVNGHRTSCKPALAERIALCLGVPSEVLFVAHPSAGSVSNDKSKKAAA
jgi:transcriptional regulator with XRE-family HTH domain